MKLDDYHQLYKVPPVSMQHQQLRDFDQGKQNLLDVPRERDAIIKTAMCVAKAKLR